MLNKTIQLFLIIVSVVLLYFTWSTWHYQALGIFGLVLYYGTTTIVWGDVVARILSLNRGWSRIFGFLLSFYLSAMAAGIPVVLWKYDRLTVAGAMLVVGLAGVILSLRGSVSDRSNPEINSGIASSSRSAGLLAMTFRNWYFVLLAFLSALFVYYLVQTRTGAYIFSPWDILPSFTLMLFFIITFLVGLLVFSNRSVKIILAVLIAFSYLAHLYLPVVYETGFGGDKWRHLAAERWLQEGNIYTPSIWGEEKRSMVNLGPLKLPEALVAGNKTSYAPQWSATIMLAESLGVDVFWIDLLLVFLLWSFFLPLILFQFGRLIFSPSSPLPRPASPAGGRQAGYPSPPPSPRLRRTSLAGEGTRFGLLLAFLPTLFYTFQSEGAITIPVSFGHLFFFFILLLWACYVKTGQRAAQWAAALLSLGFYWGYILNFFVLIGIGVLALAYRYLFLDKTHWQKLKDKFGFSDRRLKMRDAILFGCLVLVSMLAIPFLELFQGLSQYIPGALAARSILDALANAFGQMSGWIGTVAPPDFIDQGNFLYNQTKESLSRLPLFSYHLIPFVVSVSVWIVIVWGINRLIKNPEPNCRNSEIPKFRNSIEPEVSKVIIFLSIVFGITLTSYFISWSFTAGVHVLSRRLNETIVFFMILFLGWGLWLWLRNEKSKISPRKKILTLCFALALAATSTFASGPKLQLVTADELKAARFVWLELKNEREPYCVIANTWPLLGLEAESARRVTAGGFPLYNEYAQPERVKIFEMLSKKPSMTWIDGAFRITDARVCYYMNEKRWLSDFVLADTIKLLGEPKRVGAVYIWMVESRRTAVAVYR